MEGKQCREEHPNQFPFAKHHSFTQYRRAVCQHRAAAVPGQCPAAPRPGCSELSVVAVLQADHQRQHQRQRQQLQRLQLPLQVSVSVPLQISFQIVVCLSLPLPIWIQEIQVRPCGPPWQHIISGCWCPCFLATEALSRFQYQQLQASRMCSCLFLLVVSVFLLVALQILSPESR